MALSGFAGIFSRAFVIGSFAPCFFGLFLLWVVVDERALPHELRDTTDATQILVLGGVAILLGLLISGLERPLLRLFEGYPIHNARRGLGRLIRRIPRRQLRKFDDLTAKVATPSPDQTRAAIDLQSRFPSHRSYVLPTAFGNMVRSSETHPYVRYRLDGVVVWPRVELLLEDGERESLADAQTNVAFFVNSTAVLVAVALLIIGDRAWHAPSTNTAAWQIAVTVAGAMLLARVTYLGAIAAASEWGNAVRAVFDVHRLDLYDKLGVRHPATPQEDQAIGRAVTRCLLYAEPIAAELRRRPTGDEPQPGASSLGARLARAWAAFKAD